jgi:hypothetical protein
VITREQAQDIAGRVLHTQPGDSENGWELVEFDAGWLIREQAALSARGAATRIVERSTGRVMRFPSSVPSDRILTEYDDVISRGHVETLD